MHQVLVKVVIQDQKFKANIGYSFKTDECIDFEDSCSIEFLKEGILLIGEIIKIDFVEYFLVKDYA